MQLVTAIISPLSVFACFMHCASLFSFFLPSGFSLPPLPAISDMLFLLLSFSHFSLLVFILFCLSCSFDLSSFHLLFNLHFQLTSRQFASEHLKTSLRCAQPGTESFTNRSFTFKTHSSTAALELDQCPHEFRRSPLISFREEFHISM